MWCNQCEQEILHSPWEVEKASSMETSSGIGKFLFRQNINILVQYFNRNRCYKRVIIRGKQYQFLEINSNNYSSRNLVSLLLDFIHRFMVLVLFSQNFPQFNSWIARRSQRENALGLIRLHPSNFFPWLRLGKQGNYQKNERRETSAPSLLLPGRHTGR